MNDKPMVEAEKLVAAAEALFGVCGAPRPPRLAASRGVALGVLIQLVRRADIGLSDGDLEVALEQLSADDPQLPAEQLTDELVMRYLTQTARSILPELDEPGMPEGPFPGEPDESSYADPASNDAAVQETLAAIEAAGTAPPS